MTSFDDDLVYHYTDCESFLSIINNGSLWASDLEALNDPAELNSARGLLNNILSVYSQRGLEASAVQQAIGLECLPPLGQFAGESRSEYRRFAQGGIEYLRGYSADFSWGAALGHVFGVSFCKKPDLLSQWRAYGLNGSGVCVGFGGQQLKTCFQDTSEIVNVNYDQNKRIEHVLALIRAAFTQYQAEMKLLRSPGSHFARPEGSGTISDEGHVKLTVESGARRSFEENSIIEKCLNTVLSVLSTVAHNFKLNAFSEEQEARLIYKIPANGPDLKQVQLLAPGAKLIPYIQMKPSPSVLPIRTVIMGPASKSFDQTYALKILLARCGHVDVEIERSRFGLR